MIYYERNPDHNIETLLDDYAAFKATKAEYAPDENPWEWTKRTDSGTDEDYLRIYDSIFSDGKWLPKPYRQHYSGSGAGSAPSKNDAFVGTTTDPYAKSAQNEVISALQPFINQTIDEMNHAGIHIYDEHIPDETLAQMVDITMTKATSGIPQLNMSDPEDLLQNYWGKRKLSRALIEALLLLEICGRRRPRHTKSTIPISNFFNYM